MTVSEKQRHLLEVFGGIPDAQERLAAVVDRARSSTPLPAAERTPAYRVFGCSSAVWIAAEFCNGSAHFRCDAEAPVVKGLVSLMCELYEGGTAAEILEVEPSLFDELGLLQQLSPTRRNGLQAVRRRLRDLASHALRPS